MAFQILQKGKGARLHGNLMGIFVFGHFNPFRFNLIQALGQAETLLKMDRRF